MRSQQALPAGPFDDRDEIRGGGASSLRIVGLGVLAFLILVSLLGASAARAANSFVPAGEITAGELTGPARIAVDQATGNVLVVDSAKNRVDVFDSSGPGAALLTTIGEADLAGPYGIAIDQSNGDVYVTDPGNELIRRYATDGLPTPTYTLDASYTGPAAGSGSGQVGSFASAIAVDPTDGDLLVADRGNNQVSRFTSAGAFVSSFDGSDSGSAFTHLEDVTLSPAGKIFVSDGEAAAGEPSRVLRFSNAGAFEATLRGSAASGDAYLAYDAADTELIVGDARNCFFCSVAFHVLDPTSGATLFDVSVPSEQLTGLALDPGSGRLYAASLQGEFFAPAKVAVLASQMHPGLAMNAPTPVTAFSVHLSGTVNPEGIATEYHFEVSKDGGTTWQKSPDASAGEGTSPIVVEADLTVEPNTAYVAKLVATNPEGAQDETPTQPFATVVQPPAVVTQAAGDVRETSAAINGTINPYGLQTTYYFEYGPTTAYGTKVPAGIEGTAGQGRVPKPFSRTLSGLTPGATYHFRLVATNSVGTSLGSDQAFTTPGAGTIATRAYEQVTPVDKQGSALFPHLGFFASSDGNAISYLSKTGSKSSAIFVRAAAFRGENDWGDRIDTDPPIDEGQGAFLTHLTMAVSQDFSHAFVVSNRALTSEGAGNTANLYRVDLSSGSYEFIGGSEVAGSFSSFTGTQTTNVFQAGAPDLSWIVFFSRNPLLPGAPSFGLYRWSVTDGLELISVLPDGEQSSATHATAYSRYDSVSADGSRMYFGAFGGSEEGVFLREGDGPTKAVSVSHVPGDPTTPQRAFLLGVNKSGRYAFLVSDSILTSDTPGDGTQTENPGHLYRYDASNGSLEYLGVNAYTYPLAGPDGLSFGALGVGDDGETVYFNERNEAGGLGPFSVWHKGVVHNILPGNLDLTDERRSPSGRYYVFYRTVEGVAQIARYDAETNETVCVSCLPDGTSAPGQLPAAGGFDTVVSDQHSRSVDNSGTVYFDTVESLVPADVNGVRDVYAWNGGTPTLISPGTGPFPAVYADASADGRDVFFTTDEQLVGRDNDRSTDLYDARVGGGFASQNPPPPSRCSGDDCVATPPASTGESFAAGSETVNGPGNVKAGKKSQACAKGKRKIKVKGKLKCVKKHKASQNKKHKASQNQKGGNR